MTALQSFVRRLNLTQTNTPRAAVLAQGVAQSIGAKEVAAAARWGGLVGLVAFWLIEPYDWLRSLREGEPEA
jgi:hypothetical protein